MIHDRLRARTTLPTFLLLTALVTACSPSANGEAGSASDSLSLRAGADSSDPTRAPGPLSDSSDGQAMGAAAIGSAQRPTVTDTVLANLVLVVSRAKIESGRLASTKATSAAVKEYARSMVTDHTRDLQRLTTLMRENNITVADSAITVGQTSPSGDLVKQAMQKGRQTMESLRGASGVNFDRAYSDAMVAGHQDLLLTLQEYAVGAQGEALKTYLTETQATITSHLDRAKQMQRRVMDRAEEDAQR